MKGKTIVIGILLILSVVTVIPMIILILQACDNGYSGSILDGMIEQMD